jgi:hypothetical protein
VDQFDAVNGKNRRNIHKDSLFNMSCVERYAFIQVLMGTFTKIEPPKPDSQGLQNSSATTQAPSAPPPQLASNMLTLDEKLKELKRLRDTNLITEDIYLERQRKLLEVRH